MKSYTIYAIVEEYDDVEKRYREIDWIEPTIGRFDTLMEVIAFLMLADPDWFTGTPKASRLATEIVTWLKDSRRKRGKRRCEE